MQKERGFSVLELMVVVTVVGVLSSMATAGLVRHINYSRRPEAVVGLSTIGRMQEAYFQSRGYYATTLDELGFAMDEGSSSGANIWIGRRYTFSLTSLASGGYVATAVGDLDGDEFQDILFITR